jgi:type IV pilus assembly protein PilW
MQGYDNGTGAPGCVSPSVKPGTDVLVVRRVASCEAGVAGCPGPAVGEPYLQSSKCETQLTTINYSDVYTFGLFGTATFDRKLRNCATDAKLRRYIVNIYFISTDNGQGQNIPTLKRMQFNGINFVETPLVEGIEELNFEYGIDIGTGVGVPGDGQPDVFTADPSGYACANCSPASNWANVVAVRINLLARNVEASPAFSDPKTYTVGLDASGATISVAPHDAYRRHAYSTTVRVVNVSQRRESP